jgi:hypothetical protein
MFLLCGGVSVLYSLQEPFSAHDLKPLRALVYPPFFVLLVLCRTLTDFFLFLYHPTPSMQVPQTTPSFHLLRKDIGLCYVDVCRSQMADMCYKYREGSWDCPLTNVVREDSNDIRTVPNIQYIL